MGWGGVVVGFDGDGGVGLIVLVLWWFINMECV